jgi:hypothetical protein
MTDGWRIPLVLRGEVIEGAEVELAARRGITFRAPDIATHLPRLVLSRPSLLADLQELKFDDIVLYLERLGRRLVPAENRHLQSAFELGCITGGLPASVLRRQFETLADLFDASLVRSLAEQSIGIDYLEGWVSLPRPAASAADVRVRAFGARCVHVIAGNVPQIAATTIVRNAITRSDAIIKLPSNDLLTATAIARTMIDLAPEHPLTRHLAVAYWKGGDESVERWLYRPAHVDKIVAWGGLASVRHISRYLQPGMDLITFEPKSSSAIIGPEVFRSETTLRLVAQRLAMDVGAFNQEACFNVRIAYVVCDRTAAALAQLKQLGALTMAAIQELPPQLSTAHCAFDPDLKAALSGLRLVDAGFTVLGGTASEGAVIVSHESEPVDFADRLSGRVVNLVPVADVEPAIRSMSAHTQTVSVFPESLQRALRERLAGQLVQRIVPLGGAALLANAAAPQDGMEPLRRMCRWVTEEGSVAGNVEQFPTERSAALYGRFP